MSQFSPVVRPAAADDSSSPDGTGLAHAACNSLSRFKNAATRDLDCHSGGRGAAMTQFESAEKR
jgi:hypothetical protein